MTAEADGHVVAPGDTISVGPRALVVLERVVA
jgi:hypothetical protein